MHSLFYFFILFVINVYAKPLPHKPQAESCEEYKELAKNYKKMRCEYGENTDYLNQNKCFHISKRLFEITQDKKYLGAIAERYLQGYGVMQNVRKGIKLYEEIANSDSESAVYAQGRLGTYYGSKDSPVIDRKKEEYWLKKAAENGDSFSQHVYASILMNRGKINDAVYWFKKAAINGSVLAKCAIARFFREGYAMQINREKVYELLHEAAEEDFTPAFLELRSFYYADGDCEKSKFWHNKFISSDFFKKVKAGMDPEEAIREELVYRAKKNT